jgi:hypothetical protein
MKLENMVLITDWKSIKMSRATVSSPLDLNLEKNHADTHVTRFFNNAFDLILSWVNSYHPQNVNTIPIPREIPELLIINDMHMDVRENYFSFTMDPFFIVKPKVKHSPIVKSSFLDNFIKPSPFYIFHILFNNF